MTIIHCDKCNVEEGAKSRGYFEECPHENSRCEIGSACVECCGMANIGVRY